MSGTHRETCSQCGGALGPLAGQGVCGRCVLSLGLDLDPTASEASRDPGRAPNPEMGQIDGNPEGEILGDCVLLEELGRGGAAVVYRAYQNRLRRYVAVKVMRATGPLSPAMRLRFQTEARAAAALEHPNIVPVYEVGEEAGTMFLVMKLVEGGSLAQCLGDASRPGSAALSPWSPERGARFMAMAARAVHSAHLRGILHRDLKPGNLLIDDSGNPWIADFGLAKFRESDGPGLTLSGTVLGTPTYMPPEQALGNRHAITAQSDIYSLGAILYEILEGRPPFQASSVPALMQQIVEEPPPRMGVRCRTDPSSAHTSGSDASSRTARRRFWFGRRRGASGSARRVPKDLETIALKCLAKEPSQRYGSALALAEDLERFVRGEAILARPVGKAEQAWRWCRRRPALAASLLSTASAVGALVVGLGLYLKAPPRENGSAAATEMPDPRFDELTVTLNRLDLERSADVARTNLAASFPYLARILRRDPSHITAGHQLYAALTYETLPRLSVPPLHHSNRVTLAVPSVDGKWIATTTADGEGFVWNSESGEKVAGPLHHDAEANEIFFSPEGDRVVTASHDRTACVWEWRRNRKIVSVHHDDAVLSVRFSPEGDRFATASLDQTARIWSARTGAMLVGPIRVDGGATGCEFSPDGKWLLVSGDGVLLLCDSRTGDVRHQIRLGGWIYSARFNSKSDAFTGASRDGTVGVWSVETGQPLFPVAKLEGIARVAEFCPDGLRLVTGGSDRMMQLWNVRTGERLIGPIPQNGDFRFAHFSPDGSRIASVGWDQTFRIWDAFTGRPMTVPVPSTEKYFESVFFPDGRRVLTAGNGRDVLVWDIGRHAARPLRLAGNGNPIVRWSPDGRKMFTVGEFEGCLVDLGPPVTVQTICYRDTAVDVAWSHDAGTVAVVGSSGLVRLFDARTGRETRCGIGGETQTTRALFKPTGHVLALANRQGDVREWNVAGPDTPESPVMEHPGGIREFHYDPTGRWLATVSDDGIARVWASGTGQARFQIPKLPHAAKTVAFSRDGAWMLTSSTDRTLRRWSLTDGSAHGQSERFGQDIENVAYDGSGSRIMVQVSGPHAYVLDGETLQHQVGPIIDPQALSDAAFHPMGRSVLFANGAGNLAVWNGTTGQSMGFTLKDDLPGIAFAFNSSGDWLGVVQPDGVTSLWEMPRVPHQFPSWVLDYAEAFAGARFDSAGNLQGIPPSRLWELEEAGRRRALQVPSEANGEVLSDMDGAWIRWFFDASRRSDVSPHLGSVPLIASIELGTTAPGATRQRVAPWSPRVYREWVDADSTNAPAVASLVRHLVGDGHSPARVFALEATIRSRRLMEMAGDKPWAWFAAAEAARFYEGDPAARAVLEQASQRFPHLPDFDVARLPGLQATQPGEAKSLRGRIVQRCLTQPVRWEFNHDGELEGWLPNATMEGAEVREGRLKLGGTWMCPSITLRTWIDGRQLGVLKVRMRHAFRGPDLAVMWTRYPSEDATFDRMVQVPTESRETEFVTYVLDLTSRKEWREHFIREIVVGHFWGNPRGDIEIDWISLEPAK
jgi:WD40 repeat protein/serine/threonine protein kinase